MPERRQRRPRVRPLRPGRRTAAAPARRRPSGAATARTWSSVNGCVVAAPPADRVVDVDDDAVGRAGVHARHDEAGQGRAVVGQREHDPLVRARPRRAARDRAAASRRGRRRRTSYGPSPNGLQSGPGTCVTRPATTAAEMRSAWPPLASTSSASQLRAQPSRLVRDRGPASGRVEVEQVDAAGALGDPRQRQVVAVAGADDRRPPRRARSAGRAASSRRPAPAPQRAALGPCRRRCGARWRSWRAACAAPRAGRARRAGTGPMLGSTNASDSSGSAGTERCSCTATAIDAENDSSRAGSSAAAAAASRGRRRRTGRGTGSRRRRARPRRTGPGAVIGTVNVDTAVVARLQQLLRRPGEHRVDVDADHEQRHHRHVPRLLEQPDEQQAERAGAEDLAEPRPASAGASGCRPRPASSRSPPRPPAPAGRRGSRARARPRSRSPSGSATNATTSSATLVEGRSSRAPSTVQAHQAAARASTGAARRTMGRAPEGLPEPALRLLVVQAGVEVGHDQRLDRRRQPLDLALAAARRAAGRAGSAARSGSRPPRRPSRR